MRIDAAIREFLGRTEELERLGGLVAGVRNGRGSALLVQGEPGIGKSALLAEAAAAAHGVRVVRSDGYEAESAMPYAVVQRLGAPFAAHLDALPPRQRAALRVAAGLDDGEPPGRFLVGLGLLSLLAAAGEVEPLLCIVDDLHLADPESLEVLAFVGRRLEAESVGLLLATRPEERVSRSSAGVPTLELGGLDARSAAHILARSIDRPIDPLLATRIAEQTGGNPLALIDLAREFTARELAASSLAELPVPIGARLETHYAERLAELPHASQLWLLTAAAESTGDIALVEAAATRLRVPAGAAALAERARLVSVHETIAFRHPLVRSAVYNAMAAEDRRRVHAALSEAADDAGSADVAVWHAAAAAVGVDAPLAARLEASADAAAGRGGTASRARLLARAAELSADATSRDARLLAAAEAAVGAGSAGLAADLLDRIDLDRADPVTLARVRIARVLVAIFVADAPVITSGAATLVGAADLVRGIVPDLEQRTLLFAFQLALGAEGAMRGIGLDELGLRFAAGAEAAEGLPAVLLRAIAAHMTLPYADAVPVMRDAVERLQASDDHVLVGLESTFVALTMALWDERTCIELLERSTSAARVSGSIQMLDSALWVLGVVELVRGDPAASGRSIEQVRELRRAIGYDAEQVVNASYLAWTGAPVEVVEQISEAVLATGFAGAWTIGMTGLGIREIADGHYRDAMQRFRPFIERPFLQVTYQQLPDYVEASVRAGRPDLARQAADRLAEFAAGSGTPWIVGVSERAEALLAPDGEAEPRYLAAIAAFERATAPSELGRAHLVYGEWLRRMKRRREARDELRRALAIFERAGAPAFAERARRELAATGEHVVRDARGSDASALTPQEATIARLAAEGRTNPEIGQALFISTNTVDYHLRKVFRKLEVTSRRQLAEHLDG